MAAQQDISAEETERERTPAESSTGEDISPFAQTHDAADEEDPDLG
jgi:hypothetical protein